MKLLRFLLFPFAIIYNCITSIRNFLFDKDILKSTSFDIPVIAVGNLSVGGTGKSPQIEYLVKLLQNDYKIAILSRGYKRKTKGFLLLNKNDTVENVGDEPLQFFKKFDNIQVAVDANRANGITELLKQKNPPELILLDDAFQHRKVKAKAYILLTKYNNLYIYDFLLPTGNLRESRTGVKRANSIVITKCPKDLSQEAKNRITKKLKVKNYQQIFFSTIEYATTTKGTNSLRIEKLKDYEILLITGIANPKPLLEFLENNKIKLKHLSYKDHHLFSKRDIVTINTTFNNMSSVKKMILTTEKDYVRLENKLTDLSFLPIETSFLFEGNKFDNTIKNYINS